MSIDGKYSVLFVKNRILDWSVRILECYFLKIVYCACVILEDNSLNNQYYLKRVFRNSIRLIKNFW